MNVINKPKIELVPALIISAAVFIIFIILGTMLPDDIAESSLSQIKEIVSQLQGIGPAAMIFVIFMNNALKCLVVILTGFILALPPLVYLGINASLIGILISNARDSGLVLLIAGLAPHGIIEIPAFLFSSALGIGVGHQVYKYITRQESAVKFHLSYSLNFFYKWIVPALLVASLIEVFVTPGIIAGAGGNIPPVMLP